MTALNTVPQRRYILHPGKSLETPWGETYTAHPPGEFPELDGVFYFTIDGNSYPRSSITYIPPKQEEIGWLYFRNYIPEAETFQLDSAIMVMP